jgi:hypothetical protein
MEKVVVYAERIRGMLSKMINHHPSTREQLEELYGQVWDEKQIAEDFRTITTSAPLVVLRRKSDGRFCTMMFQREPYLFFSPRFIYIPDLPNSELRAAIELAVLEECVNGTCDCVTTDEHQSNLAKAKLWGIERGGFVR